LVGENIFRDFFSPQHTTPMFELE